MKTDQIIAELFALVRLLIERQATPSPDAIARLAALEAWRLDVERMHRTPPITEDL